MILKQRKGNLKWQSFGKRFERFGIIKANQICKIETLFKCRWDYSKMANDQTSTSLSLTVTVSGVKL